jgi:hypothetical protein
MKGKLRAWLVRVATPPQAESWRLKSTVDFFELCCAPPWSIRSTAAAFHPAASLCHKSNVPTASFPVKVCQLNKNIDSKPRTLETSLTLLPSNAD